MTVYGTWGWAKAAWSETGETKSQSDGRNDGAEARGQASSRGATDRSAKTDTLSCEGC